MKKYLLCGKSFQALISAIGLIFLAGCGSEHMNAGKIYLQEREYEKAEQQFKSQLEVNPQDPDALWWLGLTNVQQKKYETACEYFDKVIKFAPEKPELTKEKAFLWGVYHNAGLVASGNEKGELAMRRFHTAIEFEPESVATYINIAQNWIQNEKEVAPLAEDSAIAYYKKALELAPKNAEIYKNVGIFYTKSQNYNEAITHLKKASELKPKNRDITYRLGIAYYFAEDYTDAKESFKNVIELDSTFADAYFNLSTVLIKQQDFNSAKEILKKYIAFAPEDEEALSNLGTVYLLTKEYDLALETYTKLIELKPESAEYYEGRANVYWQLGKKKESNDDLRKAQELKKK